MYAGYHHQYETQARLSKFSCGGAPPYRWLHADIVWGDSINQLLDSSMSRWVSVISKPFNCLYGTNLYHLKGNTKKFHPMTSATASHGPGQGRSKLPDRSVAIYHLPCSVCLSMVCKVWAKGRSVNQSVSQCTLQPSIFLVRTISISRICSGEDLPPLYHTCCLVNRLNSPSIDYFKVQLNYLLLRSRWCP